MEELKQIIKELAAGQKVLKNQRKTVKIVGDRTMEPWDARCKHHSNRYDLRHMNIAYGMLRGRTLDEMEPTRKEQPSMTLVDDIMAKYKTETAR